MTCRMASIYGEKKHSQAYTPYGIRSGWMAKNFETTDLRIFRILLPKLGYVSLMKGKLKFRTRRRDGERDHKISHFRNTSNFIYNFGEIISSPCNFDKTQVPLG